MQDALLVGCSDNCGIYGENGTQIQNANFRSIKGAKTGKMRNKDTISVIYDYNESWSTIETCSHCEYPATDFSGRIHFFKDLYFVNTTERVKFGTRFKEIIYDEDGTLTNSSTYR